MTLQQKLSKIANRAIELSNDGKWVWADGEIIGAAIDSEEFLTKNFCSIFGLTLEQKKRSARFNKFMGRMYGVKKQ